MKGFILRILFVCVWLVGFYLIGYFIADKYLIRQGPIAYTFGIIYGLLVVGLAILITAASFSEPTAK